MLSSVGLLGLGYLILAWQIPMDPWTAAESVNARTLPLVYGVLLCGTAFALLFSKRDQVDAPAFGRLIRVAGLLLASFCFVFTLEFSSLWLALALLLAALAFWLGERRLQLILVLAVSVPLIGWLGIEVALGLYLP